MRPAARAIPAAAWATFGAALWLLWEALGRLLAVVDAMRRGTTAPIVNWLLGLSGLVSPIVNWLLGLSGLVLGLSGGVLGLM